MDDIDLSKAQGLSAYPTKEEIQKLPWRRYTIWDSIKMAIKKLLPPNGTTPGRIGHIQSNINLYGQPQFFKDGKKVETKDLFNRH